MCELISRGLVIRQPWMGHILRGEKRWELRSRSTTLRGPIALIQSGSGLVVGTACLARVIGPLQDGEFERGTKEGLVVGTEFQAISYAKAYAWVLEQARPLATPLPYDHPQGAVIWVRLPEALQNRLAASFSGPDSA